MTDDWFPAWEEAAGALGLSLMNLGGPARLQGSIEGVELSCRVRQNYEAGTARNSTSTVAEATPPAMPPKLRLSIARGYIYPLGRPFFQDIRTGDEAFDDRFIVKGSNEELVRLWLSPRAREHIGAAEDWSFSLRPGQAIAELDRAESSRAVLVSALHGLAALAGRGLALGNELDRLAGGIGGRREPGGWDGELGRPIELDAEGTRCTVEHRHGRFGNRWRAPSALYTRVACPRAEGATRGFLLARRRFSAAFGGAGRMVVLPDEWLQQKYVARAEDADHLRAQLTPAVRTLVSRTLPDAVVVTDEVSVWSLGLTLHAPGLSAMVEVAAALAQEALAVGSGPYR